ncbi:MAG TPA: hypothetical protein VHT03_03015 [Rhizomicrobium sp.]|jgi:hypothetical protein|nr:hypothetical protein [Rhizomicrobium sp.]
MKFAAALSASVLAGAAFLAPAARAQGAMPMDTPTTIGGVETVCTGIGEQAQNPQWLAYPVRLDFSNGGAQYLSGAHVELASASGRPILSLDCNGPIVLFRLEPGTYKVSASLMSQPGGGTASATFAAPRSGQKRVVLDFSIKPNQ